MTKEFHRISSFLACSGAAGVVVEPRFKRINDIIFIIIPIIGREDKGRIRKVRWPKAHIIKNRPTQRGRPLCCGKHANAFLPYRRHCIAEIAVCTISFRPWRTACGGIYREINSCQKIGQQSKRIRAPLPGGAPFLTQRLSTAKESHFSHNPPTFPGARPKSAPRPHEFSGGNTYKAGTVRFRRRLSGAACRPAAPSGKA